MGKNKNTVILLGVLLVLLAVSYPYLMGSKEPETAAAPIGSEEMSVILQQVNSIKLDMSIVQNTMLKSLKNDSLPPLNLPTGKTNPFTTAK